MLSYGPRGGQSMMCVCVCVHVYFQVCFYCIASLSAINVTLKRSHCESGTLEMVLHNGWKSDGTFLRSKVLHFFFLKTTEWNAAQNHERASTMCYRWAYKLTGLYCRRLLTEIRIHDPIRPVGTDFQSTSCVFGIPSLLSLLAFLKNGFLTTIFP